MAGDQRTRRGHPDPNGLRPGADAGAGLLAQRRVSLVADDDRVGVGDLLGVADEPLVRLDGDRAVGVVVRPEQRGREAVLVAAVGDLADELVNEVAAVGQDQDAARPRAFDEAQGGHRLAGAGRVLEPEAAIRTRIFGGLLDEFLLSRLVPVERLLLLGDDLVLVLDCLDRAVARGAAVRGLRSVAVAPGSAGAVRVIVVIGLLELRGERGERSREHVDLVLGELGVLGEVNGLR